MLKRELKAFSILIVSIFLALNIFACVENVAIASPKLSYRYIGNEYVLLSQFETEFNEEIKNRAFNIQLAVKKLNNYLIYPDDEFSFNKAVGERSELRGFKLAKVIINSKFQDDFGGGVCQVSTTLFNALILANLKITESHQHTLAPSYIEPSFDAMVSYGWRDLRILNDSGGVVKIMSSVVGNKVKIDIWGTNSNKKVKVERVSVVEKVFPFKRITLTELKKEDGNLIFDEFGIARLSSGVNGMKSSSYLKVYENGKLIRKINLRSDLYRSIDEVIVDLS